MTQPYNLIPNLADLSPDVPADTISSRTFYKDDRLSAILFGFAPGQELSEHTSAYPAVLHFLRGRARVTLGEDEMTLEAGAWAHMAPRLPHSIVAETPVVMLLLMLRE
ncbi:MAG: cupin domain-containing protein [Chloroflexota bacterium]|jgi:quercetin dioxygenase-like cupin family protein